MSIVRQHVREGGHLVVFPPHRLIASPPPFRAARRGPQCGGTIQGWVLLLGPLRALHGRPADKPTWMLSGRAFVVGRLSCLEGVGESAVLVIPHFCLTGETLRLASGYRLTYSGYMPQGKHKGARVILTMDRDRFAEWKRLAEAAGLPVATMMRETLDAALPSIVEVHAAVQQFQNEPEVMDEVMGRIVWQAIKSGAK